MCFQPLVINLLEKSTAASPYSIDEFEEVFDGYIAYPQPWFVPGKGFFLFCTVYHSVQRVPRWRYSTDGRTWSDKHTIVNRSHYQITEGKGNRLISVYNLHPGGVDKRTNLYFVETRDFGETWQNINGETVKLPLENDDSSTLIYDARSNGDLVYLKDVVFNNEDHPTILYLLSKNSKPGPAKKNHRAAGTSPVGPAANGSTTGSPLVFIITTRIIVRRRRRHLSRHCADRTWSARMGHRRRSGRLDQQRPRGNVEQNRSTDHR